MSLLYLLDTDISSYLMRSKPQTVVERFTQVEFGTAAISCITYAELHYGIAKIPSRKVGVLAIEQLCEQLQILDWNAQAAEEYGKLRAYLELNGTPIGNMDMMIAAHALALEITLVTNNIRHFDKVPGLKVENWV